MITELPLMTSSEWKNSYNQNFSMEIVRSMFNSMPLIKMNDSLFFKIQKLESDITHWQLMDDRRRNSDTGCFLHRKKELHRNHTIKLNRSIKKIYNEIIMEKLAA